MTEQEAANGRRLVELAADALSIGLAVDVVVASRERALTIQEISHNQGIASLSAGPGTTHYYPLHEIRSVSTRPKLKPSTDTTSAVIGGGVTTHPYGS